MRRNPDVDRLRVEYERSCVRGLAAEWALALESLPPVDQAAMIRPVFRLSESTVRLGAWSSERNEISISRRLVREHSWDAVREVLRHEMAHQLADVRSGPGPHPPHGAVFREACRALGVAPGARLPLHERIYRGEPGPEERLLSRIRKLLALAESRNPHEAEAAMLKAHELLERHHVAASAREEIRRFVSVFLSRPALRHTRDVYHMIRLLREFYFVEAVWVPAYVVEKGRVGRAVEISGTRSKVKMAGYVHDFVKRTVDRRWEAYNRTRELTRHRRTDFAVGIVEGFRAKLQREMAGREPTSGDLVPAGDPQLDRYVADRYPRLVWSRRSGGRQDDTVRAEGYRIGQELVVAEGLDTRGCTGLALPPPVRKR